MLDPACVARLNTLIEETGSVVVISSTWRRHFDAAKMQQILEAAGFVGEVIDCTTRDHAEFRGNQINAWLKAHPEVESFVILDDRDDMVHLAPNLVQTFSESGGLQDDHITCAIKLLE